MSALVARGFGIGLVPPPAPLPPDDDVVRVPLRGAAAPSRRIIAIVRRGGESQPPVARGLDALHAAARR